MTKNVSGTALAAPFVRESSLAEALERRLSVEREFAEMGHSYRHGKLYRAFEHNVFRPVLKTGLELTGLYSRGLANALAPVVQDVALSFPNLPSGLNGFEILQLSDFHVDENPALADALLPFLAELRPDICVFTGDYRFEDQGSCEAVYPAMEKIISAIRARYGIFGILGNHDAAEIAIRLEEMGVHMLVNESVEIGDGPNSLWLAGVDDPFDYRCADLPRALAGVPRDAFQVLLCHAPELYDEAERAGIDLYLSGHTHAGQIRLPLVGALRKNADCPREYAFGHWRHGNLQGYTSAGVGCSSLPVRFGCPPEIVRIELVRG